MTDQPAGLADQLLLLIDDAAHQTAQLAAVRAPIDTAALIGMDLLNGLLQLRGGAAWP